MHPEKIGQPFDQVVKSQSYTTASSVSNICDEIARRKYGKNVIPENIKNNLVFKNDLLELEQQTGKKLTFYDLFLDRCSHLDLDVPVNDESVKDNLNDSKKYGEKPNGNRIIVEQLTFAMSSDFANQIGWHAGDPVTPEIEQWARDSYQFFIDNFGARDGLGNRTDENVLVASLHLDEDAPHLQIAYIPLSDRVQKKIVGKEPARDKNGEIKYYLKPDSKYYNSRHKYTTLNVKNADGVTISMANEIQRDADGKLKMKMKQVRRRTAKGDSSFVPALKDADGHAMYEVSHTGKPRISHSGQWLDFLDRRKRDMKRRGIETPAEYLDANGRSVMKPWNALQDVYFERVSSRYGMGRGRVGSHGKGERPSREPRRNEERKLEQVRKQTKDAKAKYNTAMANVTTAYVAKQSLENQNQRAAEEFERKRREQEKELQQQHDDLARNLLLAKELHSELDGLNKDAETEKKYQALWKTGLRVMKNNYDIDLAEEVKTWREKKNNKIKKMTHADILKGFGVANDEELRAQLLESRNPARDGDRKKSTGRTI